MSKKVTRSETLAAEHESRRVLVDADRARLREELARVEGAIAEASASREKIRTELARSDEAKKELDAAPDIRKREEAPATTLELVTRAFSGAGTTVYDEGAAVDPSEIGNYVVLKAHFGTVLLPEVVRQRGWVCNGCGVTYIGQPAAAEHRRREQRRLARNAVSKAQARKDEERAAADREWRKRVMAPHGANDTNWHDDEVRRTREAAARVEADKGDPIPRPPTREETAALKNLGAAMSGHAPIEDGDGGDEAA